MSAATEPARSDLTNAIFATRIKEELRRGASIQEAMDLVLGAGVYTRLAGEVYDAFKAEEATEK